METLIPLILIGMGSAAIVVGRDGRVLVAGLGVQWLGVAWATLTMGASGLEGGALLAALAEGVAAAVCVAILWLTLGSLDEMRVVDLSGLDGAQIERLKRAELRARRRQQAQMGAVDQFWPLVIALAGGMAGFALARLYPLGGSEESVLAFYWVALSGVLALVLDGAREPVKLGVGLLALLNGAFLLVNTLGLSIVDSPVVAGAMAVVRIGLAALLAYGWMTLKASYNEVDLTPLFDSRSEAQILSTTSALVTVGHEDGGQTTNDDPAEASEPIEPVENVAADVTTERAQPDE